jgi:hypothetical protein
VPKFGLGRRKVPLPLEDVIAAFTEHDIVSEFFHGIDFRARARLSAAERANQFQQAFVAVTADEEKKKRFLKEFALFERLFKLLRGNAAGIAVIDDEQFFPRSPARSPKSARQLAPLALRLSRR